MQANGTAQPTLRALLPRGLMLGDWRLLSEAAIQTQTRELLTVVGCRPFDHQLQRVNSRTSGRTYAL